MRRYFFLLLVFSIGFSFYNALCAQTFNRPVPSVVPSYEYIRLDSTRHDAYFLACPYTYGGGPGAHRSMMIVDEEGYLAWWAVGPKNFYDLQFRPELNLYSYTTKREFVVYHYLMDHNFNHVDSFTVTAGRGDVHDFQRTPSGNWSFLGIRNTEVDLSGDTINGMPGPTSAHALELTVWEMDDSHNVIFQWNSLDHIPTSAFVETYHYNPSHFDYIHGNSIDYDTDSTFILSLRSADAVYKVNRNTGNIMWRLGGNYNEFTFTNDAGFHGQHDVRILPNGNLSMYDNHFGSADSRGVEYELDVPNRLATKVREYAYDWPVSGHSLGSYRQLDNGYSVINWGHTNRPEPSMTLLNHQDEIAVDFLFSDGTVNYRTFYQPLPLPTGPEITCTKIGNTTTLSASAGHQYYFWSTGESGQSITVSDTGTYQVWATQGIGMIGSQPYYINNFNQCSTVGIEDHRLPKATVIGFTDLLGRKIERRVPGQIYLIRYSDGSAKREVYWE